MSFIGASLHLPSIRRWHKTDVCVSANQFPEQTHNNQGAFPWQPSPLPASVPCIVATLRRTKPYITSPPCEIQLLLPLIRREQDPLSASRVPRQMSDSVRLSAESSPGQDSSEFLKFTPERGHFGAPSRHFTTKENNTPCRSFC